MKIDYFVVEVGRLESNDKEVSEALTILDSLLLKKGINQTQIIRLTVFYNQSTNSNYSFLLADKIKHHFKYAIPALSLLAQPPLNAKSLVIEVSYIANQNAVITYKKHRNVFYTTASLNSQNHIFISGLQSADKNNTIQQQSVEAFSSLEAILHLEGFKFTDIVRQWNYIQGIIAEKDGDQNYQIFNDVRTQYYNNNGLVSNYPAATGIGIKEGGIIIEVHAIKPTSELHFADIHNPLQIDAFAYSEKVLEGKANMGFVAKTTPKFSRAKLVAGLSVANVLVSGTASIHGEETIGLNDIEKQTHLTIKNIYQLIDKEHLSKLNPGFKKAIPNFTNIRVYIKNADDFDVVKKVCAEYFDTLNITFVEADICRDNLLVEIEGVVGFNFIV